MSKIAPKIATDYLGQNRNTAPIGIGDEWGTPLEIIELTRALFGRIDVDPASNEAAQKRIKAKLYYTKADNGLEKPWIGKVFLNPPYSRRLIELFVDKLRVELASGRTVAAIMLVNNCADTRWFRKAARAASMICFPQARVKFLQPDGNKLGSPPRGQAILYFGPDPEGFKQHFRELGLVGKLSKRKSPSRRRRFALFL
jgi:phage N-6-adenine-methyltransferase